MLLLTPGFLASSGLILAFACCEKFKPLRTLFSHLPRLTTRSPPIFRDVELSTDLPEAYTKGRVLGPHCQCPSRHARAARHMSLQGHRVRVPPWVAKSFNVEHGVGADWKFPRYQEKSLPKPGTSKPGTFRHHGPNRCLVPAALYTDLKRILLGLASARSFINLFKVEIAAMLGPVGMNDGMVHLQKAASICWDWELLLTAAPTKLQEEAFLFFGKDDGE